MSSKWSEKSVTNFLKAYKQHPCLWNPYHKDYYNCREKNEALRKIIEALGTPGLTVTDYLQQIKIIREKYKREQARTIKCIQSQTQYKSPFPWHNIVAEMLRKVINDEERANLKKTSSSENSVLKSLSSDDIRDSQKKEKTGTETKIVRIRPCTDATCNEIIRRSKSVEKPTRRRNRNSTVNRNVENRSNVRIKYIPCPYFKKRQSVSKNKEEDAFSSHKATRDIEPTVNETSVDDLKATTPSLTTESNKSYGSPFLQCPACGWETVNYNQIDSTAEKPVHDQQNFIPCSSYIKDSSRYYTLCTGCDQVTRDESFDSSTKKYINNSGDFGILEDPTKQVLGRSRVVEAVPIRSSVELKKVVDEGVQYEEEAEKLSKNGASMSVPVQTKIFKFDPVTPNKLQSGVVEACLKIILSGSRGSLKENETPSVSQNNQEVQYVRPESKTKQTQSLPKNIIPNSRRNETTTNTVNYAEVGIQNTVCISDGTTHCISIQTLSQTDEERRDKSTSQRTASKEVTVNMVDKATKGIQCTVCVSRANLCRSRSPGRTEVGTTISAHRAHSIVCTTMERSSSVQSISDGRNIPVTRTRSHGSINHSARHVNFRSVETESVNSNMLPPTAQEYEDPCRRDTCPYNVMNLIKNDPAIALMLQKLLYNILFFKSEQSAQSAKSSSSSDFQIDDDFTHRLKGKCTIEATEIINKIKEHMIRTLGFDVGDFGTSEAKELYQKFDASMSLQEVEGKSASTKTDSSISYAGTMTMTDENDTKLMQKKNEKILTVDKEVSTCYSTKDVCTNDSLQLIRCEVQTQSSLQLLKDSACPDKCEQIMQNKISVGTQKRDPILVRVIKCAENQSVVRCDKQTLTARIDMDVKSTDKRKETCGRSTCTPYNINKKLNEKTSWESAFCKKREDIVDNAYHKRSVTFNNYICDPGCNDRVNSDWTDVTNVSICPKHQNTKLPLGIRLRK